jgi:hypothetical protein
VIRQAADLEKGGRIMLIALLAVLGVDLGVIVAVLAVVLARRRWVSRQPGAFHGAIRVTDGDVAELGGRNSARIAIGVAGNGGKTSVAE